MNIRVKIKAKVIDNSSLKLSSQVILRHLKLTTTALPPSTTGTSNPGKLWALELGSGLRMLLPLRDDR